MLTIFKPGSRPAVVAFGRGEATVTTPPVVTPPVVTPPVVTPPVVTPPTSGTTPGRSFGLTFLFTKAQ